MHQRTCTPLPNELPQDIFDHAKRSMSAILAAHNHQDRLRVVALLRLLTKHQVLREYILSPDILETLGSLLDPIIRQPTEYFGQAMGGLICLLQCAGTRQITIDKLGANPPNSNESRLSQILEVDDSHPLTAALRMTLTLAQFEEARAMCAVVKPGIRKLATMCEGLVGYLAAEILLVLYDPNDQNELNIHDKRVRANIASALVRLSLEGHDSAAGEGSSIDHRQQLLRHFFGLDAEELSDPQRKFIRGLKQAVEKGKARERTAATMTLLKFCHHP
ncbi:hypothetical protein L210DRAFT_3060227 [Boletus edulis BED1]|uniref:Uncharacterized protein n=1 Tax=Boletus edulis BED1 TaxID=1328754 RepID=A0AAD4C0E7_BOLED|nr:hypothetical protein L210DRAFT_3060227 [Boletus edulis BED1]